MSIRGKDGALARLDNFSLWPGEENENYVIKWYQPEGRRTKRFSTGTANLELAKIKLEEHWAKHTKGAGIHRCVHCGSLVGKGNALVADTITGYLRKKEGTLKSGAHHGRLKLILDYIASLPDPDVRTADIDEQWAANYRRWALETPYTRGMNGKQTGYRKASTVEAGLSQLQAAMNLMKEWTEGDCPIKITAQKELNETPQFRLTVEQIAAMFRYCMTGKGRTEKMRERNARDLENVLAYLRLAVITWHRPEALYEATTKNNQWWPEFGVFDLNPSGRRQTTKFRPALPIPESVHWFFNEAAKREDGRLMEPLSASTWRRMTEALGFPQKGQSGPKLIRRSMMALADRQLGPTIYAPQVGKYGGHHKFKVTELYTLKNPEILGRAMKVSEAIMDEIEALCPGALRPVCARLPQNVVSIEAGKTVYSQEVNEAQEAISALAV